MVSAGSSNEVAEGENRPPTNSERLRGMAVMTFLGGLYIATSSALIGFNKYLMTPDRFPYAVNLVLMHAIIGTLSLGILFCVKPSFFPALTDPARKVNIDASFLLKGVIPVAALFCGQLVLSNTAYLHSSVAFLQMMKEANLVFVYIFSLIVALERFSCSQLQILVGVLIATAMTIHGEMNFSFKGFAIQGTSQLFEASKIVLQALLLCGAGGKKLDPLTYCLLVLPFCALFHSMFLVFCTYLIPHSIVQTASWGQILAWSPYLFVNSLVAVMLNITIALFIKHSEAVSFILAGICKDAMIVSVGAFFFREIVSGLQAFGFMLQMFFVLVWSLMKSFPRDFEGGLALGMGRVLFGYGKLPEEKVDEAVVKNVTAGYGTSSESKKAFV